MRLLHELPVTFITEVLNFVADVHTIIEIMPPVNEQLISIEHHLCAFGKYS